MNKKLSKNQNIVDVTLVFGLLLSGGAFRLLYAYNDLYGDIAGAENSTSQILYLLIYIPSILFFLTKLNEKLFTVLSKNYMLLLIIIPTILSTLTSPDPSGTFRRVIALSLFFLYCLLYIEYYIERDGTCDLTVSKLIKIGVILNLCTIVFIPSLGIHQASELSQTVHAGAWRGIFYHRSTFGHVSGMMAGLGIYLLTKYGFSFTIIAATTLNILFVAMSNSGGALAALVVFFIFYLYFYIIAKISLQLRQLSVFILILASISFYIILPELFDTYASFTGEDATLSGRTEIWNLAFSLMSGRELTGLGYGVGYLLLAEGPTRAMFYRFQSIQNGFIEYYVSCGLIGLMFLILFIGNWLLNAFRFFVAQGTILSIFSIAFMFQFFAMNVSEENFIKPHSIFVFLMIYSYTISKNYLELSSFRTSKI